MNTVAVLLTRYNLPSSDHENRIRASEGWLIERTGMFERYTVPSVRAQTYPDRHWIVYLDPLSPDWLKTKMAAYAEEGLLAPVYREAVSPAELRADLAAVLPAGTESLITANLDNDDAIAPDFLARLAGVPVAGDRSALYLSEGLIRTADRLYRFTDPDNAFCAVRSPWAEQVSTCWLDWHNRLHRHLPVARAGGAPAWLQVVHDRNVSNRARGRLVSPAAYRSAFGTALADLAEPGRSELLRQRLVAYPARSAWDRLRRLGKNAVLAVGGKESLDRIKALLPRR